MNLDRRDIDKDIKERVSSKEKIEELKQKPIKLINGFMEESGLSYFEVFIESELADIMDEVEADNIRLVRVRAGTKRAIDNDYYHKRLSQKEILSHDGNFGVCIGYNHLRGKSLACVDIDGIKIKKLNKKERQQLPRDQLELLDNMTEERKEEIEKESKDYLLTCVLGALPSAMVVETQSGGYHVFINNQTHIEDSVIVDERDKDTVKKFHYVSNHLRLPQNCPIKEIRGLPVFNGLEVFTKFETKYCVLAGSFIKNNKAGTTNSYKLMEFPESVNTFGELGTVADINKNIKEHFLNYGFTWEDPSIESAPSNKGGRRSSKKSEDSLINPSGILKELNDDEIFNTCQILLPFFKDNNSDGFGHDTVFALGGYFSHTITKESNDEIFKKLWKEAQRTDDINEVLRVSGDNYTRKGVKTGLKRTFDNIQLALGLSEKERDLLQYQLQEICVPHINKVNKSEQDLFILIKQAIAKNKEPTVKILADYVNRQDSFYIDYETGKKYKLIYKEVDGEDIPAGFEEVTIEDISIFLNERFGENNISIPKCKHIMEYITNPIKSNYDLIIFDNGTLNTIDGSFKENYFPVDCLPKIKTDLKYFENAEDDFKNSDLYKEFHDILKSRWAWNESLYYLSVGVSAMAINEADKLFVIVGVPNARKTTLLTPLKRFFTYSELKIQTIAKNERFQLLPAIRKDINIDDDLTGLVIKDIGFLNSFVSGAGGNVERKGENISANLTMETTPKIWGASNRLPAIMGDGFKRRLCLILAENPINIKEVRKSYQTELLNGERDEELGLLISYSIQEYIKNRDKPFLTEDQSEQMLTEWNWKSYPAKMGAEFMFLDSEDYGEYITEKGLEDNPLESIDNVFEENWELVIETQSGNQYSTPNYLTVKEVNQEFKKFYKWGVKTGKIFQEQSRPSTNSIKKAMQNAGFNQTVKRETIKWTDEDGDTRTKHTTINVYEDCLINPDWKAIYRNYKNK